MDDAARELAKKLSIARDKLVWGLRDGRAISGKPDEETMETLRRFIVNEIGREPTPDEIEWTLQNGN
jgi:hypothetical protein